MIELSRVSVAYKDGAVPALRDVTLRIPGGDFVFLVGPTGAGKSTLLRLLYRDLAPTEGRITVGGRDITHLPACDVPALRRQMGIILQDYGLLPDRSVWDNVAFACQVLGQGRREMRRRIPEALDLVGMTRRCDAFPHELSGGEQQRVAIARALVNRPPLLLADEPTGSLDPETSRGIMDVLAEANRRGATVVVVTHDQAVVDRMRRRVVCIDGGRVARDSPEGCYAA
jgi:cell division ATP-binding protein FtsE